MNPLAWGISAFQISFCCSNISPDHRTALIVVVYINECNLQDIINSLCLSPDAIVH